MGVRGRLTDLVIFNVARSWVTGLVAGTPRLEWSVSPVGSRSCFATVSSMRRRANSARSTVASIQPGT